MKKALFLCALLSLFQSCKQQDIVREDAGKVNSVSILIDELLWNGEIGDSIRNKFASPIIGLPQEEPLFTINQYPVKLLEGYMANSRNIIIVKKGARNNFEITQNESSKPQTMIRISGRTSRDILSLIEQHSDDMIAKIHEGEIVEMQKGFLEKPLDVKRIADQFKIKIDVPSSYSYAIEKPGFTWLKQDINSGSTSILIYELPLSSVSRGADAVSDIMRVRDSIGRLYIHGSVPDSHMITENSYSPYFSTIEFCRRPTLQTRGTWQLDNDFMSGPFLNYAIIDEAGKRVLVLEGFTYAPSKNKRDLMLELEAILRSVKFLKAKQ